MHCVAIRIHLSLAKNGNAEFEKNGKFNTAKFQNLSRTFEDHECMNIKNEKLSYEIYTGLILVTDGTLRNATNAKGNLKPQNATSRPGVNYYHATKKTYRLSP